jgi:hypothetical protein
VCRLYSSIVAANLFSAIVEDRPFSHSNSLLYRHLKQYHADLRSFTLLGLIAARLRLADALHNSVSQLPQPLPDDSPPFQGLKVWDRLECKVCVGSNPFQCISDDTMRKHLKKEHEKDEFREARYRIRPAQTWFPNHYGGLGA